jgi:peroxiredoxin
MIMVKTESSMLPLGTTAPAFHLPNSVSGEQLNFSQLQSDQATVVMFICNHCPFVVHIAEKLSQLARDYNAKGVQFIAISSNDINEYPDDAPDKMRTFAQDYNFCFPYLYDESQATAKAYHAACTPDFYIFDGEAKCCYRGRFDDSTPHNGNAVTGKDLCNAIDAMLTDKPVSHEQYPSIGCNIKWKETVG